ncbi:ATP-binding cassette domain-containing protein [Microbacteriaceae bacterium VKM Ac-2855]|nr:ATP-binding cassette domain-containing protein [Microbacteriaceae bacterium VKM Ac-2855]
MLDIHNVSRSFGGRAALQGVSFTVEPGRMTGFVGGNGAGKTTTMRIILGVLSADSGTVSLDGEPLGPERRRSFGYMPEERGLYPKMKVGEQIAYLGRLHGMSASDAKRSTDALLDRLELGGRTNDLVESLSLGNQQRAQIAAALVHDPDVLVLDEPFSGLDPLAVRNVQDVLTEHAARGVPVLFSSHQLDIVERLCDDLVVIADGRIRASGARTALQQTHGGHRYELTVADDAGWVRDVPGVRVVELDGPYVLVEADDEAAAQSLLRRAFDRGAVRSFTPQRPSLAQVFTEVVS